MGLIIEKQKTKDEVIRPKQKEERTRRKVREGSGGVLGRGGGGGGSGSGGSGDETRGRRRWKPIQVVTMAAIRESHKARSRSSKRHKDKAITSKGSEKGRRRDSSLGARDSRSLRRGEIQGSGTLTRGRQRQGASSHSGKLEHSSSFNRNHVNNKSFRSSNNRRSTRGVRSPSGTPSGGSSRRAPRPNSLTATFQALVPLAALSPAPSGPDIATRVALIACGGVGRSGEEAAGVGSEGNGNIIASGNSCDDGSAEATIITERQKTEACGTAGDTHDTTSILNAGEEQPSDITSSKKNTQEEECEANLQNEEDCTPADSTYDAEDIEKEILGIIASLTEEGNTQGESSADPRLENDGSLETSTCDAENKTYIAGMSSIPNETLSIQDEEKEDKKDIDSTSTKSMYDNLGTLNRNDVIAIPTDPPGTSDEEKEDETDSTSIYENVDSESHITDISFSHTDAITTPIEEENEDAKPQDEKIFTTVLHRRSFLNDSDEDETQRAKDQSQRESWPRRVSLNVYITEESYEMEAEDEDAVQALEEDKRVVEDQAEQEEGDERRNNKEREVEKRDGVVETDRETEARKKEERETGKEANRKNKATGEEEIEEAKEEMESEGNHEPGEICEDDKGKSREENRICKTVNIEEANMTEDKKMKEGTPNEGLEVAVATIRATEREGTSRDKRASPNEGIDGELEYRQDEVTMEAETSGRHEENEADDKEKVTETDKDEEITVKRDKKENEVKTLTLDRKVREEDSEIEKIKAIADGLREIRDHEEAILENVKDKEEQEGTEEEEDEEYKGKDERNTISTDKRDVSCGVTEEETLYYRRQLLKAIQSLDTLNDQIVEFVFSGVDFEDERHGGSPKQREALKSSMALMRRLLVDAQSKFRKMVEDNKQLASRIDGDLQTAHQEVSQLRQELADTNRRITELTGLTPPEAQQEGGADSPDNATTPVNGSNHSELTSNQLVEEVSQLRLENEKLSARNRSLQSEVDELRRVKENMVEEDLTLKPKINEMTVELTHAKEALSALKADRKRLKAEKFDLLNQMKQLYATLEDKEKELRDFIRNYEQRMKDSDESLRHLAAERDETEREKWNILKHARDESERVVKLSAQLGLKEATVKKLQEELDMVRKQLNSVGYYSDAESVRTNGLPTPTASTPTCSPLPVATPTPTPNGRGSSADSGVRLSSDRESTASHDGGPGTPKESPSLSPLYATPAYCRAGEDQLGGGDKTPTTVQTPAPMSGLANSSANAGGLSRSAEQLCERLSETGEISKAQGTSTLMRKNHKSGGTWGSISRVFARQKKRAALDTSIYDGSGSDKRASWSPSSSLCASPLTEESYSEKLRLLEEAQHIPLERWKAPTVLAWLEVTLGMAQYGAMCAENVRSGKVLLELSDSELEAGLGITHPMHRKKLRLAIEELREPRLTRYPRISALGHTWVSSEWLPDLGLPQYSENFANSLVDGRLLEALTKKELEKHLGVHRKFHQASIIHGVHLLRIVRFDRQVLAERRRQCELVDADPVVWTNLRWVRWARSIDLAEYADNLKDSGVHGALVVLEPSFTADTMATALGIPQSKNIIRRHLATELESLVNPARQQLDEQARYAKMERRRQEKLASGGSLGRSFSRSYGTGLEKGDKDKRRASLRGSLSRALGLRLREEAASVGSTNGGGESSSSGGQSPAVTTRAHPRHGPHTRPRSSIMPSQAYFHHETHRRVKSIGDIETITVTPV